MINIIRDEFVEAINVWSKTYTKVLFNAMSTATTYIDVDYAKHVITNLDTFCPIVRLQCLNDMHMLNTDTQCGMQLQEDYNSFGDYCYDKLKAAFMATNDSLALNSKLYHDIDDLLSLDKSDLSIASNYIAWNNFSGIGYLGLTNFRRVSGVGLCYDMTFKSPIISTNNVQELTSAKMMHITEIADVINALRDGPLVDLIDSWSGFVNDKLQNIKKQAEPAWNATYQANSDLWLDHDFTKNIVNIYCTLQISNKKRVTEILHRRGKSRTVNWQTDVLKLIQLDYLNNGNFSFTEQSV